MLQATTGNVACSSPDGQYPSGGRSVGGGAVIAAVRAATAPMYQIAVLERALAVYAMVPAAWTAHCACCG